MSLTGLRLRTQVISLVRSYLTKQGFEELEPQLFSLADTLEPTLHPFSAGPYYLPTSPEAFLKQAMAAGMTNCFAISHAFRSLEGQGRLHHPEFVMAEWYQSQVDYHHLMSLTQSLVRHILPATPPDWPTLSWIDLWHQAFASPLDQLLDPQSMIDFAMHFGLSTQSATWEQLFHQLADIYIVPHFPQSPFFLIDYPAQISPLAKPCSDRPGFAERFELFIDGIEIANGNTELFSASSIKTVMLSEQSLRPHPSPLHQPFLDALNQLSGQLWSGVGLGIDRLAMIRGGLSSIHELNSF